MAVSRIEVGVPKSVEKVASAVDKHWHVAQQPRQVQIAMLCVSIHRQYNRAAKSLAFTLVCCKRSSRAAADQTLCLADT
jgi:hypothetical protein